MTIELSDLEQDIEKLPPLSEAVNEAIAVFNSEYVDYDLIEEKVNRDPPLTVRILKVANSPFYGFAGKISNIKHASMILGIPTTRNIVLSAGVMETLNKDRDSGLDFDALWRHSASTGVIAKALAKAAGVAEAEAFTAGLLHDIGKMVLDIFFTTEYEPVLHYRESHGGDLKSAEQEILGFNHAVVGARVAAYWKLPDTIVNACEYHHNPLAQEASPLAQLTYLANSLYHNLHTSNENSIDLISGIEDGVVEALDLSHESIAQVISGLESADDSDF